MNYAKETISEDMKSATSSSGETFYVGEEVSHQDESAGTAKITSFELNEERQEVRVNTDKGFAHLGFLEKLRAEEPK